MSEGLLLDTHAAIWFAMGELDDEALERLVVAGLAGKAHVSPVTAWEVGLLARPRPDTPPKLRLLPDPGRWYARLVSQPLLTETPLTADILIASSHLPGTFHGDPADRMLVATARALGSALMTRDRKILTYAEAGHLTVVPC